MLPEAAEAHLPWLRTRLADYGADVRARLLAGLLLPASAPITGQRARRALARRGAAALRALRPARRARRCRSSRRGSARTRSRSAGSELPYRLSLIPFNSPWSCLGVPDGERPVRLRRRAPGRPRADRPAPRRGDGPPGRARLPAGHRLARAAAARSRLTHSARPVVYTTQAPSKGRNQMSVLIKGGRIVTAADDYVGDVFVEDGKIALLGASLDVEADKVIDATGKIVMPGAIDPHTHIEMFFGGTTTCDDFTSGTTAAAFGGHDDADRLLHPGARDDVRGGARGLPREARALPAGDRRRLPHRGHRPEGGRHARGPREAARRGRHLVQALHGLQGRRDGRRRDALQGDADRARDRRARDGARRERRRDRHHRQGDGRGGEHRPGLARPQPADGDGGRGDEPRDPARARRGRAALRRPRLLPAGRRADRARAREGLDACGARRARSTSSSTSR